MPELGGSGSTVRVALAIAGLTFVVCGWLVFMRSPAPSSLVFLWFCLCSGLHWGGPLEPAAAELRRGLVLFYLLVSGLLAATLLLRFTLRFLETTGSRARELLVRVSYIPVCLGAVLLLVTLGAPPGSDVRNATQGWFLSIHSIGSETLSALALVVLAVGIVRSSPGRRPRLPLALMVTGMLIAWVPGTIAAMTGAEADLWNLTILALPIFFTIAVLEPWNAKALRGGAARIVLLVITGSAGALAPSSAESASATVLPSRTCRGFFIVPVRVGVDGNQTLDLLLDTGASRTYIDPRALSLVTGAPTAKLSLDAVWIGSYPVGRLKAYALPMRQLSLAVGSDIDGILGFPTFRDVPLTLDYPAREVRIESGGLPHPDGIEILRMSGKRPHIDAIVANRRMRLLVDSGATGRLQIRRRDQVPWTVAPRAVTSAVTAGGVISKLGGRVAGIARIGPLEFEDPIATIGSESQIGWHVLRHFVLTFDQRGGRMRIITETQSPVRSAPFVAMGFAQEPVPAGIRVARVFPGTSAAAAGLHEGDLVIAINGRPVHSGECEAPPVDTVPERRVLTYVRDGVRRETTLHTDVLIP